MPDDVHRRVSVWGIRHLACTIGLRCPHVFSGERVVGVEFAILDVSIKYKVPTNNRENEIHLDGSERSTAEMPTTWMAGGHRGLGAERHMLGHDCRT